MILAGVATVGHAAEEARTDPLAPLRWNARVVIIASAISDDARARAQRAALAGASAGLEERRTIILSAWRDGVDLTPDQPGFAASGSEVLNAIEALSDFEVLLVGLDGGVKQRWRSPIDAATLFQAIDAMPMRQDELRQSFEG